MSFLLAVPSCMPGGLDAQMGMHFGHCDIYTIVEIEDNAIKAVGTLENVPHQQGGCMAPVQHLASHGVKALLAGGMGMRPLMGFQQVGVNVFFAGQYPTVGAAVQAFLEGSGVRYGYPDRYLAPRTVGPGPSGHGRPQCGCPAGGFPGTGYGAGAPAGPRSGRARPGAGA